MLDFWTTVWGRKAKAYVDIMLPSLLQPGNIPAAAASIHSYTFYADEEAKKIIQKSPHYARLEALVKVVWLPLQKGLWEVNSNTLHQMRRSAELGHYMMVCSPDDAVGDGSIGNLVGMTDKGYNPIMYQLPRVRPMAYRLIRSRLVSERPISNRELVSITMGTLIVRLNRYPIFPTGEGCWKVWHPTPTAIIKPDQWIVDAFAENWGKNWGYDNCLPYMMIEKEYPWYLVQHSDEYFHIEIGQSSVGPSHQPMNSPCCTWKIDKARATVLFFSPHRYPNRQSTIWQPISQEMDTVKEAHG